MVGPGILLVGNQMGSMLGKEWACGHSTDLRALRSPVLGCIKMAVVLDGQDIDSNSYAFMKSEGAKPHFLLKRTRLEWGWMGWMSVEEDVLPGKALTASALLPVPCLALVTQDYMMSHRLASAPETTDSLKIHPSSVQKRAAGETNGNGQSIFPQENFCLSHGGVRKGRLTSRRRRNHSRWKLVFWDTGCWDWSERC